MNVSGIFQNSTFLLSCNVQYIASVSTAALVPGRGTRFFLLRPVMGLTKPHVQRVLGGVLFLQVKELGHVADCSPQFRQRMSGALLPFRICVRGMYRDNFCEQNTVCNKCIWLYDICYCSFYMIQGTVAGMILKQTNGPAMLHQQRLAELVLA